jgi:hypothetical protein
VAIAFLRLVNPGVMNADSSARPAIQDGFEVECRGGPPPGRPTCQSSTIRKFCPSARPAEVYKSHAAGLCRCLHEYRSGDRA